MSRASASLEAERILDAIFVEATRQNRKLGAAELMRAIGLQRTSINSTYSHVNERRKRHNAALVAAAEAHQNAQANVGDELSGLRRANAQLRREITAERERSEQYARVIRQLAMENHELKHADGVVTDARERFNRNSETDTAVDQTPS